MRVVRFNDNQVGLLTGEGLQDVTTWALERCARRGEDPVIAFIEAARDGAAPQGKTLPIADKRFGPPIRHPGKIIGAVANYMKHTQEMNPGVANPGDIREKGFFLKAPSSIIGPGEAIRLPFTDRRTDHEAELGVIIGRSGKDIAENAALDYVFGYTCLLDISVRGKEDRGMRKSYDTFTPLGPWITTKDEIPDPNALDIQCKINGEIRQHDSTRSMIMSVRELIAWVSSVMVLYPGDIIATGTPAGVGPLHPGDNIELTIEKLGTLKVHVTPA